MSRPNVVITTVILTKSRDSVCCNQCWQKPLQLKALFPRARDDVICLYLPSYFCDQRDAVCGNRLRLRLVLDHVFGLATMEKHIANSLTDFTS